MRKTWILVSILTALALALRVSFLDFTFTSSDDVDLAFRILAIPGFEWMTQATYGYIIYIYTKISVGLIALLGIPFTEFWWRLPIALLGTATVPIVWLALRTLRLGKLVSIGGAAVVATFPVHVFHSRYLWGFEPIGFLCLLLFVLALVRYFETKELVPRILSPLFFSLYLISHGYILPVFGVLFFFPILFCPQGHRSVVMRFWEGMKRYGEAFLFIPPLLFYPIYKHALLHTSGKSTQLGLYLEHVTAIIQNMGIFYAVLVVAVLAAFVYRHFKIQKWPRYEWELCSIFLLVAAGYIAPLLFGAPPGITLSRAYLQIGPLFLLIAALVAAGSLQLWQRKTMQLILIGAWLLTTWGTMESMYFLDRLPDPSMVQWERGTLHPDSGAKSMGYLFRRGDLFSPDDRVLLLGHSYEPPNVIYYFGLLEEEDEKVPVKMFFDLNHAQRDFLALQENQQWATVIAMDPVQHEKFGPLREFEITHIVHHKEQQTQYILRRTSEKRPVQHIHVEKFNALFDAEYAKQISERILAMW